MSQQILLTLNDTAGNALGQYNINTAGSALHIQAVDGAYYQFTDPMTGIGPEGIITEREGDNLLVSFDEGTDLVIENYFAQNEPGALVGMQADGGLFSYPVATAPEHVLAEELAASQTLGSEQPVWAPLGVLGAVGLVAAGIGLAKDDSGKGWDRGNNGGSGSGNNPSPNTPAPNPSPNNPSNPSNPGGPNIPSPNPGNPGNPGTPTPTPNPSPYPPAPSPNPVPQPPTPNQPGSDPKPIANHDKVKGTPKEKVTIDVLDNDSGMDANGQRDLNPSSIRLLDAAGKPVTELTVAGQGKWNVSFGKVTFTPDANFTGNPTPVQYTVSDNAGQVSNKATITVTYDNGTPGVNTQGRAVITGDAKVGQTLSADINDPDGVPATGVKYQWMAGGVAIRGATGPTYTVSAADKDKAISLIISYTDNRGNPENISTPSTSKVVDGTPTPQPPQPGQNHPGSVVISGNAKVGEKLTADVHDDDQFDEAKVSYQWQRDGKPITGANGKTYTLTADDEGHKISVKAEYTDNAGNKESHDSAATTNVAPSTSTNHAPTDITLANNSVIEGKDGATIGKLTTTDPDAGDQHTYTVNDNRFEVTADGTLKLKAGQHLDYTSEKTVTLQITSDDGHGGTVSKTFTLNVQDDPNYPTPNPQPPTPPGTNHEGTVTISGEAKVGETLTAKVDDADGVPTNVQYQWLANGVAIAGATGSSYQLTAAEAGKTITVRATYTDNAQHSEAPTSAATTPVVDPANPNPHPPVPPTNHEGTVSITGEAKVGETLTATVNDDDGVPANVTYQWLANGVAIAGATGSSYQLTAAEAGKTISVRATYTDNAQHSEAPTSAATTPVVDPANPNPQPPVPPTNHEGTVTITGEAKVGETLTATVNDDDGVPANVTYQWLANGVAIAGATGSSYQLTAAEAGKTISVRATYTDNAQHSEAPTSAATTPVVDPTNPQPPQPQPNHEGTVSITGEAKVGETLTATVNDDDGVPANVTYQWLANGVAIAGATGSSYQLTAAEAGKTISVRATYTDNAQHSEAPISAATTPVVDPANPQPPQPQPNHEGTVSITGEAKVGETLTATVNDDDGVPANVTYQWLANGVAITGATGSSYQLTANDAGKTISVRATYTDNAQHSEAPTSAATTPVVDPANPQPPQPPQPPVNHEGDVAISGNAKVGETLTAQVHDADQFDEAKVSYQWQRDGQPIANATGKTYTLTAEDEGHKISVKAEYSDNAGNKESHDAEGGVVQPQSSTNQAPTDITLDNDKVAEGKDGAEIGKLTTTDPDTGDQHTYKVSDDRFEVTADGTLKLKDGKHLDYANEKTVTLQITSDDGHGGSYNKTFTLNVEDDPNYPTPNPQPPQPQPNHEGTVSITGEAKVGETLTAKVDDADGVPANVTYQWLANGVAIAGATGSSYQLTANDAGKTISVRATYTDNAQHSEAPTSAATTPVVDPANPNPQPPQPPQPPVNHEGDVAISGNAKVGETLTATVNDDDGVPANVTYQWLANGVAIAGATGSSYQLTANDAGKTISVRATYTDNAQHSEAPTSAATTPVVDPANPNPQPPQPQPNHEGTVSITGEAKVGETLTATVNDDDGVPANVTYQWLANGVAIAGATGSSYQLTANDAGKTITVRATYTDNAQHSEAPTSAATTPVVDPANPNPQPPVPPTNHEGTVTITGEAKVGETLTATVNDDDGVPANVTYQWLANGVAIAGAAGSSYQLTANDAGKTITVRATYTDNAQHSEAPTSAATTPVVDPANPNPQPPQPQPNHEGTVTITGEAKVGETLTATVNDDDGVPANVTYQWLANGVAIAGATGSSYQLTANDAGKTISVRATYTDNAQHSEAPTSSATTPVIDPTNPNPQPPQPQPNHEGDVAISGNAKVGETLTAQVHDADQFDEAKVNYQWQRDGQDITGANGKSYTLTAEDEGHKISVKAEYTDNAGNKESHDAESGVVQPQSSTNQAPTDISLDNDKVAEGKDGAAIGKLTTTDPDAGDKHTYKVSDDRFEVTNDGTLKLKDGKHLDYANEKTVTLQVTTDDGHGGSYNKTFTLNVEDDPNYPPVNPPGGNHEGTVTISGNAKVGETLTAEVQDQDGVPDTGVTYQWLRDGKEIAGATGKSYTLTADDVGQKISVKAAYQDNAQHAEAPTSAETEAVTQIDNNQPGSVTIVHPQNIETGAVLRAVIDDSDGVPTAGVLYQWLRDGKPINHANPVARYELRSEDEGHDISVHVEYTDKNGHKESLTSEPLNFPEDKGPDFTLERGTGTEQGGVTLIPTEKATIADLNYEKNGLSQNVHIVRADANSPWHSDDPLPQGVTLDAKTGVLKVAPQEVDDGSQVYASVYEGRSSKTLYLITENDVGNPPLPQSEAEVSFYTTDSIIEGNAQSYVVRLSKPAETDVTVELKISHVSTNESQIHAETRTITIPKGQISKTVFVETEDDKQFSADARFQAELQNPQGAKLADQDTSAVTRIIDNDGPQAPVLKAGSEVGGVEILPQEGAKILHVYYQSEADGSTQDFVATRNNDGRWTAREPHDRVTLDAQTGKVTLGALAVQDRSEVRAFNESELHVRSEESKIFAGDNPASPPPAVNQQGTVTISGDPKVGSTLTAEVKDGDGVPSDGVKYQWLRDGNPIASATGKSYVLTAEDAGHKITVKAEYDDNAKHHETPVSQPTENIADNAPPAVNQQGTVTISGDPKVGSTLTAEVKDGDGVPSDGVKYQWLRDGNPIASATGKSYVLTAEDAGHKITVKAEYDDNAQNHETPVSQPTENIADNSAPPPAANHPGSVTLEGEAKIGHTLTAKLTDADGVPDSGITWRWYGDDKLLPGVEGQTITLTDAVKGMQLRAEAVYTDKAGHAEKPISDLSPAVVPEAANNSDLFPPPAANAPHITLSGVTSVKEGEKATYTVSLDKPASEDVSVDVHVKHNSTDTSDANLTWNIQRVVIPKGETSKNFTVDTHNDGKAEGTETYTVEIGNALVGNVNDNVPPFSGSVSAQSMIIPAYKYPTGGWEKDTYWESVHKAGGGKVPYVIVNPASGVGEKVNSDYAKLIDDNITAGIKNIGYIRTHYQTRPIEEVKAEVDKYLELYGKDKIHGYFFDEITAQNNQGTAYMAELYRYVKAKAGDKLVMANPGTHITDAIAPYADIFVTSEVSAKTYLNNYEQPKSAFENDPKNAHRIMHMIHDVTPDQYDAVIKASRERNAGWVFPTSDTQENPLPEAEREKHPEQDGNPYNALPQNFDQLAANVNNLGMPTNPTQHDNNGKLATANIDNNHVTTEIVDANNAAPLEHHEPQLQPADGAVASAADGLEAAAADHTRGGDGHDVLIGDGIDAAAYSQLVSHQGEDLLQYLGQHSAELLAASQQSASHELHGGAGDDVLIAGHGAQLLEGGAGADTFAYLLDSNDAASWNEPSRILDFNPQEGDRIVLAGGEHLKAEVSHDASGQHLHVTDDAGHSRTIDIGAQNGKTLTAEDILSHVEIRTPQGYSEPASSVPQTHHLPQDDHSHLI